VKLPENIVGFCLKDPNPSDGKSFGHELMPRLTAAAGDVDLEPLCSPVSDQQWISACVPNATADAVELCNAVDGLPVWQISRLQIYFNSRSWMYKAQLESGEITHVEMKDEGSFISAAFEAMSFFGICPENLWDYKPDKVNLRPDIKAIWYALKHKLDSYYKIRATGSGLLDEVRSAIGGKHPVVISVPVPESFLQTNGPTTIGVSSLSERIVGRHAVVAMGRIGENIKIRNSWGTSWRAGGYALLTPEWFTSGLVEDACVPTNGMSFRDTP